MKLLYSTSILFSLAVCPALNAAVIAVANANFEAGADGLTADSWTDVVDDVIYYLPGEGPYSGGRALSIPAANASVLNFAQQDLGIAVSTETGMSFTVGFDGGFRNDTAANSAVGQSELTISLVDGAAGAILSSATITLTSSGQAANVASIAFNAQAVGLASYTSTSSNNLFLRFTNPETDLSGAGNNRFNITALVDDVTLESAPEPSSIMLLGLSGLALLRRKR